MYPFLCLHHVTHYSFLGVVGPPYIAEISPKSQRGRLVSFVALSMAVGVLVSLLYAGS